MAISALGYLGFGVSDMTKWEEYATKILGLQISEKAEDGTVYLRMDEHHHRVSLHPDGADDLEYVGWQTANKKEFEKTKQALFDGGIESVQATAAEIENRHVVDMVKFDVSGVRQEVYYGPHFLFEKPFISETVVSGFKTHGMGMGHVGIAADDDKEMIRVFTEVLGFEVSDSLGAERFLHCNPREHTALIVPHREGGKRIAHFMIELNDIDDVGMCLDRVMDNDVPIQSTLGKHTNDHMISFYMRCPSGFGVEYGWNGRQIDDATWQVGKYSKASIWGHRRQAVDAAPGASTAPAAPAAARS